MSEQELDLDNLDNLLEDFDGVTVEGGVDSENDDGCEGGATNLSAPAWSARLLAATSCACKSK